MYNMKEIGFSQYCITKDGRVYSLKINRFVKQQISNNNYFVVSIGGDDGVRYRKKVHRLLMMTFKPVENQDNLFVNHIDGNKQNNSLSNLEWVTPKENAEHAVKNRLYKPTWVNKNTKFISDSDSVIEKPSIMTRKDMDDELIHLVFQKLQDGYRKCDVSKLLGVSSSVISALVTNPSNHVKTILDQYDLSKQTRSNRTDIAIVIKACELLSQGNSATKTAKILNIHERVVMDIKARKRYLTISSTYSW